MPTSHSFSTASHILTKSKMDYDWGPLRTKVLLFESPERAIQSQEISKVAHLFFCPVSPLKTFHLFADCHSILWTKVSLV